MKKQKENTGSRTTTLENKVVVHHLSDGSELTPNVYVHKVNKDG